MDQNVEPQDVFPVFAEIVVLSCQKAGFSEAPMGRPTKQEILQV